MHARSFWGASSTQHFALLGAARAPRHETICSLTRFPSRYIVYDIAQVNLKYLLKLKFNFKTSLW